VLPARLRDAERRAPAVEAERVDAVATAAVDSDSDDVADSTNAQGGPGVLRGVLKAVVGHRPSIRKQADAAAGSARPAVKRPHATAR
jgi:hypothetical protein